MSGLLKSLPWLACLTLAHVAGASGEAWGDVVLDGTANPAFEGAIPGTDQFDILAEFGRRAGDNLFHSFERFSLATDQTATFSGPDAIRNVISRVTGGEPSNIDGTIASTMPSADFYFINPAGVLFGPNASLNVPGSFHVSSADQLQFEGGEVFSADLSDASSFSFAAPEAFGFLGANPARIRVNASFLQVPAGEGLSIIGGDIEVSSGFLIAEAGELNLVALSDEGAVRLSDGAVTAGRGADITLREGSSLRTSGDGGGTIRIRGGAIVIQDQTVVAATNLGATDSQGGIEVEAVRLEIRGESGLAADVGVAAQGNAGTVTVTAVDLEIRDGSLIRSSSFGAGAAGRVTVDVGQLFISRDGAGTTGIMSDAASSAETGLAGTVTVRAGEIELRDGGEIRSSSFGAGDAGRVIVDAGHLLILGEGLGDLNTLTGISSQANRGATGDGGSVSVTADRLELRDDGKIRSVTFGQGRAGTVRVRAHEVVLESGGQISSSTFDTGDSGNVRLTVEESLSISGQSRFQIEDGTFPPSGVFASTNGFGPDGGAGGTVTVTAPVIRLADRGEIAAETFGGGAGGNLRVISDRLVIDDGEITTKAGSSGDGGRIKVKADVIELRDDGLISAQSTGSGNAGNLTITARDELVLERGVITTSAQQAGGGRITIQVRELIDLQKSRIASSVAQAGGNAGDITIDPDFLILDDSQILAQAVAGSGGDISIVADNLVLSPDSLINAEAGEEGVDGTVATSEPAVDLASALVVLDVPLLDADRLLRERCAARRDVGTSSFIGIGRGGLPASPDQPLGSAYRPPAASGEAAGATIRPAASTLVLPCSSAF